MLALTPEIEKINKLADLFFIFKERLVLKAFLVQGFFCYEKQKCLLRIGYCEILVDMKIKSHK